MVAPYGLQLTETHTAARSARELTHDAAAIADVLARFDPISLPEMENVKLLNRTDTKYVMRTSQLHRTLARIADAYRVLDIDGTRLNHYQTLYFDTPDFTLYRQHHNGLRSRYKVRIREYVGSDLAFWEVKRKTNRERTVKSRRQTQEMQYSLAGKADDFVDSHTPFGADDLEPKLLNEFLRITLVSTTRPERLTLDLNLAFSWDDQVRDLPGIVIAEVKQEHFSAQSDFVQQMRAQGIRPGGFSKYCTGVTMLYDGVKTNNFKPLIRRVEKMMQEELTHDYVS